MSGPVWRYESGTEASCAVCLRTVTGVFVEGEVADNALQIGRRVCPDCYHRLTGMLVGGELGVQAPGPAYARR
jgi:hypothetical protein